MRHSHSTDSPSTESITKEMERIRKSWTPAERHRRKQLGNAWLQRFCRLLEIHVPVRRSLVPDIPPQKGRRARVKVGEKSAC
jgi:hypothetical protein